MIEMPRVSDSLRRINAAIAAAERPRDAIMLEVWRDHWLAEVANDVPAVMATLPERTVSYRFDGVGLFFNRYVEFHSTEAARDLYRGAAEGGLPMAGPFQDERWAFAEWGMVFEGINTVIVRGRSLQIQPHPLDPDGLYFLRWRSMSSHPIDVERRLMLGEHVFGGSLVDVTAVGEDAVAVLSS
jgi:hypothetical protein